MFSNALLPLCKKCDYNETIIFLTNVALIKFVALPMEKPKHEIPLTNEGHKIILFIILKSFF